MKLMFGRVNVAAFSTLPLTCKGALALLAIFATIVAWADFSITNPVTGETESYTWKFVGTDTWNNTQYWQNSYAENPSAAPGKTGSNLWDSFLFDGNTININDSISVEGWNIRMGVYNGANITMNSFVKIQGDVDMWFTVDSQSKLKINFNGGNIGQNGRNINFFVASEDGIEFKNNFSGNDQGATINYYLTGFGSVKYLAVNTASHKIKQADVTLIGGDKEVKYKTLVSFTSTTKTFTADAAIKVKNSDGDVIETVSLNTIADGETTLTTDRAVGACELVKTSTGIFLYYVDGEIKGPTAVADGGIYEISAPIIDMLRLACDGSFTITGTDAYTVTEADLAMLNLYGVTGTVTLGANTCYALGNARTLPAGYLFGEGAAVAITETVEEYAKDAFSISGLTGVSTVVLTRFDGTTATLTVTDGVATLGDGVDVKVSGVVTIYDITFKNNASDTRTDGHFTYKGVSRGRLMYDTVPTFNNDFWDDSTGVYLKHHPYIEDAHSVFSSLEDFTVVVVGQMSPTPKTMFIHFGSVSNGSQGLLIATTDCLDEVIIAVTNGDMVYDDNGVKVKIPNAATARHSYVVTKRGNAFSVYVDGIRRGSFACSAGFALGSISHSGIQVGADFGGRIRIAGVYKAVNADDDNETGVVNVIRVFGYAISDAQAEAIVAAYPYVAEGGLYTRTVVADGTFSETDAWAKDGADGAFDVPVGATVDGVDYNPSATLMVGTASALTGNADIVIDTLTVGGAALTFVSDGAHSAIVNGAAVFNTPVKIEYGAVNLSGTPVQLGSSGEICFDCSGLNLSRIRTAMRVQLTGLIDRDDARVTFIPPSPAPQMTVDFYYNEMGSCYEFSVTPGREPGTVYYAGGTFGDDSTDLALVLADGTATSLLTGDVVVFSDAKAGEGVAAPFGVALPEGVTYGFDGWTGTIVLPAVTSGEINLNDYGVAGSTVGVTDISGTACLANVIVSPKVEVAGTMELNLFSASFVNTICKLTGGGVLSLSADGTEAGYVDGYFLIEDVGGFSGSISLAAPGLAIGPAKPTNPSVYGQIQVATSATVYAGATWTAPNGIVLASTGAMLTVEDLADAPVPTTSVADAYVKATRGGGATVYSVDAYNIVIFDLGGHATRTGGGELMQKLADGEDAAAPEMAVDFGWLFRGWAGSFSNVTASVNVAAQYESAFPFVDTNAMDGVSYRATFGNLTGVENLAWSASDLPDGLTLSADGTLSGTVLTTGMLSFIVTVTAPSGASSTMPVSLYVAENPNHRPLVSGASPTAMPDLTLPGETLTFNVTAFDPDGDELTYVWLIDSVTNAVNETGEFVWTPEELDGGTHMVTCLVTDGFWCIPAGSGWSVSIPKWHVSGDGNAANAGTTASAPFREIQQAVDAAEEEDVIFVAEGVYGPIHTANKRIRVLATGSLDKTIIDGGGTNRCVYAGNGEGCNNTLFDGFTIRNGRIADDYGAGARGGTFYNCVFNGNVQTGSSHAGGATSGSCLYNCLLVANCGYNGGGANYGTIVNCTIVGNTASNQGGGTLNSAVINSIVWGNTCTGGSTSNYYGGTFSYSCTLPAASGTGNISANPYFTASAEGDYRLLQDSPCLDAGNNSYVIGESDLSGTNRVIGARVDMGAYEGWVYLPLPGEVCGFSAEDGRRIGAVRLTWTAAEYARTYTVCRSVTNTLGSFETIGTTASCFFDDETATPEATYWYRVIGVNPAGEGSPSAADSGWCLGEMVFGENTLQTATAGLAYNAKLAISGGSGNYTWKTGADDYDVVYGESTYLVSDTVSTGVSGDDACLSYPLPFDFPFYGKSYNKVWVNSNGTLNFDGSYNGYAADEATLKTKAMIAVMWKDLRTGSGGVGVVTNGTESITFLWNGASYYSGGAAVNASVTLYADGTILCSYGSGNASGGFVGVSAGDGTHYRSINLVGTSLENYDDIRFVPQDVPGGMTLATDGTLSGVAAAPGTYTFTVFVTDSYGNGATQKVTLEVEENPNMRTVQFDLGEYGVRGGGGDLLQYVLLGGDATPPTVRAKTGWLFDGWTGTFTNIADSVVVTANYRSTFADLEVSSIEIPSDVMSGNNVEIRWTVANTGNPQFSGTMTEKVTLVSAADDSVTIDVASPSFNGTIARNGSVERSATVAVPLKGWVGTWKVRVETAIRPSVREFADNNVTVSTSTFEITAAPLPDLSVKSIALDLDPAEYMPLDTVTVRYVAQNTGTGAATAPWRDRLYLCKNGAKVTLATVDVSDDIAAGAEVERTIQCVIPELVALSGGVAFVVKVDCDDSIVELADDDSNENATWEATPNATLGKRIYLAFNSASVYENSGSVRFYAKRSGETDKALVLSLSAAGATSDVTFPAEITIGAGGSTASGYVYPIDNNVVEGARNVVFTLTPPVASGFDAVVSVLTILDNEVPKLTMSFDKVSVKEGDAAIVVTVTRELVTDEPLTVYLNGVSTSHCSYPSSVVIPAGEASVAFELAAVDNDAAEIAAALTLRASANGYTAATQSFSVEDDDVPSVTLTIYPEELSEGAGPNAAYAILSRVNEDNIGSAITVNLTPSIPNQLILQSSVTIPAYTMAVRFQFGPVDNGDDEPDRDITITGSIYIPSCGCSGQPSSGDVIEATIRIIDNDVPALSLTADPSTMKEGLDYAGDLILSHNSVLTEDLVVSLSFDTEGEIEIPASVVIPAGETSVTIPVKTIDDGETDGGKLVSVYADDETKAFKSASTWIQVSDQNLPDLKVMTIARPSSVYAGKKFDIEFGTANVGFVAAPSEIEYAIYLVGGNRGSSATSSNKIYSGKITGGIIVDDSIVTSYTVTAPSDTGDYRIVVVLDPDGKISELDDANNSLTSDTIAVSAAYTATVTVAEKVYLPGDEIAFNGVATMPDGTTPAANLPIDLYILVNGMRRTYHLTADSNGAFGMTFEPSSGEAGRYTIGACYPGVASTVAQDYFDILGMRRSSTSNIIWDYALGDVETRTVYIQNRSGTPLTGLTATFTGIPEACDLQYTLPDTIPANGSVALTMTATAVGVTEQVDYSKFAAHLEVAEGLALDFPLYFHSQTQKAYLRANPSSINTTMAIGHTRYIDVTISNDGKGDSGAVTVSVPSVNWLRIVSGASIDNLASGESATVTLAVSPTAEDGLTLNSPLSGGRMAVNCANGTGCSVSLKFTPVSEATGSITVDAVDNNTYTLESAPHLSNATVRVSNPYTGATVATGKTGTDGIWTVDNIPEGTYQLTITAPNHDSYADAITIEPGRNARVEAFLQYQIVTATWTVERTEIEDSYDIQLLLDFETQVPAPIVNTIMPTDFPTLNEGESWSFTVTLQNTGVIAAEKVTVVMPQIEGYTFTLSDNDVAVPAKSAVDITGVFSRPRKTRATNLLRSSVTVVTTVSCTYREKTIVVYPCGKEHPEYSYEKIIRHGECEASTSIYITDDNWNPGVGGGGGGGTPVRVIGPGGGTSGPGGFSVGPGSTYTKKDCNVCLAEKKAALDNCRARFDDIIDYLNAIIDRRMVSNSDCIGSAPLFTGSVTLPNQDRKYGDLATDVYGNNEVDITKSGYRPMTEAEVRTIIGDSYWIFNGRIADTAGLKAWLYVDKDAPIGSCPSDIYLVYAGTEHADDWMENVKNGVCSKTGQYETASSLLQSVLSGFAGQIHVVGHSLGGGLTQYAMLTNDLDGRVDGTTFNSAGLCESSVPDLDHCNSAASAIRNFRALNDPVSFIGHHLGPIYTVGGADGHFISYFGSNPPNVGYWTSIGWSFASGAALWIDLLKDKIDDLKNYYNYGLDGGAIVAAIENCLSRLLSTCDEYDSPYSIADIFDEAALGRLKTKSLEGLDSELSAQLEKLQVLPLAIAGDLAVKGNLFGGSFKKGGAITKVDTWLKVKERVDLAYDAGVQKAPSALLTRAMASDEVADEWLQINPSNLIVFLESVAAYDEITLDQMISIKPVGVSNLAVENFYFRMTNTVAAIQANSFSGIDCIDLEQMYRGYRVLKTIAEYVYGLGYDDFKSFVDDTFDSIEQTLEESSDAVCASVTLQLSQSVSMTREAFNGTLTMYNGNTQTPITALKMDVSITDEEGNECKDMFVTNDLGNSGATSGGYILEGGLTVAAGGTGSSVIQFIPERRAAETEPKLYKFGGTITYIDPFSGELATINLTPVALTVNPSPYLHLDYFVQRDVFADDPFTPDVVEASMPAELAVLVRNVGGGNANKVTIASAQPEMVQNEKGLSAAFDLKDYTLEASALNGATAHLGLNTVSLGTIEPNESKVAQWWLTSTIEGHFIGMSATVTPVNSWNTPDTALVDPNVGVHKLVRSIVADGDTLPDFLVCDGSDLYGTPNEIYTARGDQLSVNSADVSGEAELSGAEIELPITVVPTRFGWNYGYLAKAGLFRYTITRIVRSDDTEVSLRNVWITDRTFRDGNTPFLEERLHIVDEFESGDAQAYTVYLTAKPTDAVEVSEFNIGNGSIEHVAHNSIDVQFSKAIDASTFTIDDVALRKQGVLVDDISSLSIAASDATGTRFTISGLAALCGDLGRYELVVQCAGIADLSGHLGISGESVAWTLSTPDSPYILDAEGRPTKRVRRMDGVTTVTSVPVTEESAQNLVVTLNGTDVSQFVTIRPSDNTGTRFSIEGLDYLQLNDGDYTLVIDCANLVGVDGGSGVDSYTVTWTRDTTAPVVNGVSREMGLNGTSFILDLTEDADPETISLQNVMLTRKTSQKLNLARGLLGVAPAGETEIALPATARLSALGDGSYSVSGLDSVILADGTYTLYFDASGVADEAGNEASGVKSVSWTVDTTAPDEVTDITVSPEYGSVDTCVYTATRELTISGTVPESGLTVEVFAKYVGSAETLLAEPEVDGDLRFTAGVTLPGDGNLTITIRLTDEYGNSSDTEFSVYVDVIALGAEISGMPEPDEAADALTITFLNGTPDEASALAATMSLTKDGVAVAIPNVAITRTEDRIYTVSGLANYTAEYGTYVFSYDVREVAKVSSGMTGSAVATAEWVNYPLDTTAPTIADIRFNGAAPAAAYVTDQMFTEVAVRFSEAVNVPELVEQGIAGQAFSIQFLSDDYEIVGSLSAEDIVWNATTFTASWTIDGSQIPCGKARLVVNPVHIKDASGNTLATTDAYDVISGAKTYEPSLLKSGVAYSYACPALYDWNNDGLLDLVVGEKTEDAKGKARIYLNRGTASQPEFDDYTYLQKSGEDVEFAGAGCVGMQVSFGRASSATMFLATSYGEIYGWRHRARNPKTKESLDWDLWFDHTTDSRFSSLIRTQTFCCDIDGDGRDEVVVSGQNSPMFWMKRTLSNGEYVTECTPLMDADGAILQFPAGQNHTAAIMADVSGDAVLDLVTGDTSGNVWVYYGTGSARFAATPVMIYENTETSNKRSRLAIGDIDGDGVEDILVGRQDGSVLLLKGEAILSPAVNFKCVEIKSVEEALNDYIYWIDGAEGWTCEQFGEEAQATVTHTGDAQMTVLSAKFTGMGTVTFTWAVSGSNESSEFCCTGGDSTIIKNGPFNLIAQSVTISTLGEHIVNWVFTGRNTAIVRDVAFTPTDESLQVTQTTAVPIPFLDINRFANEIWKANGGDYEATAKATAANGKTVMDNCIAGVDSADPQAEFKAKITYENGVPKISWIPALNGEIENEGVPTGIRNYKVYGADNLESPNWQLVTPENKPSMRFFRVTVEIP